MIADKTWSEDPKALGLATSEVWSGEEVTTAKFLQDSLQANGIGCVIRAESNQQRLLVRPANESRAREIIREVLEGTPPN